MNQVTRTGYNKFDKLEFLTIIYEIRQSTFKKDSIRFSFCKYKLILYNS